MNNQPLRIVVRAAATRLLAEPRATELLKHAAHELVLTHRFAVHLETLAGPTLEGRSVDIDYNRHALDKKLWVSSTKSMMGHLLGAAGAVESAVCALAISEGKIPPTINLEDQDEKCPLDYVANKARERVVKHALNNSFGFGGTNCSLVFSRYQG